MNKGEKREIVLKDDRDQNHAFSKERKEMAIDISLLLFFKKEEEEEEKRGEEKDPQITFGGRRRGPIRHSPVRNWKGDWIDRTGRGSYSRLETTVWPTEVQSRSPTSTVAALTTKTRRPGCSTTSTAEVTLP
ncbi:hypothetical protein CDAR_608531 [Caerostris darwini]|uniref:Uncharacterized protein n=1 Tax=Caerostris darwini TaxID=1538125 RepID=A0AAV4WLM5_9ARAC|nr:hypothetical protein CDAR_608531 [Caerostris darwini]